MKFPKRIGMKLSVLLLLIIIASAFLTKAIYEAGEFDTIWDHPLPDCHLLALTGAEDMTLIDNESRLLISTTDRQGLQSGEHSGIYLYDGITAPKLIYPTDGTSMGISSVVSESGSRVFVIVHKNTHDVVQILNWANDTLTLVKEVAFEGVTTLNGIVALDGNRFFASQDLGLGFRAGQEVEKLLRLPLGKLWVFDGSSTRVVREKIAFPNGLALAPDKKILYLASMLGRSLMEFDVESSTLSLQLRKEIPLQTAPDNLKWSGDRLLIGSHPQLLHFLAHSFNAVRYKSPAQLIAVEGLPDQPRLTEIYSTRGRPLSAVTTGVIFKNRVVMGAVFAKGVLDCAQVQNGPEIPGLSD